jgi:putative Mn2+ efflux pump MntP
VRVNWIRLIYGIAMIAFGIYATQSSAEKVSQDTIYLSGIIFISVGILLLGLSFELNQKDDK